MVHTFEIHGLRLALDVESGALHVLDGAAWFAVRRLAAGAERETLIPEMAGAFGSKVAAEVMDEIEELQSRGLLFSPRADLPPEDSGVVKALCLHLSHDCDMRCAYCFAATGHYGGDRSLMPERVAKQAVDFLLRESGGRTHCEIDFFGGEPLLNFDVLQNTVAYGKKRAGEHGKVLRFTVTTNALNLDRHKREYLYRENISLVLSLDGRKEVHDRMRRLPEGGGTFQRVLDNIRAAVSERKEDNYYLRGTFTRHNPDFASDVFAMAELGFNRISLEPAVLPPGHPAALAECHLEMLCAEYGLLARQLWERESKGEGRVSFFHFELDLKQGPCARKRAAGCGAGASYLAVAPDGTLYPCHQFVGIDRFKAGHVNTGRDKSVLLPFGSLGLENKEVCLNCFARFFCGGGCHAAAWLQNGSLTEPYHLGCLLQQKRVECGLYLQAMRLLEAPGKSRPISGGMLYEQKAGARSHERRR